MTYKLEITKAAGKFLESLPPKQFRQVVLSVLKLRQDPEPNDSKQLIGYTAYRRVDVGEYRVIYKLEADTVYIALIGKRNDDEVYKKFGR